MVNTYIVTGSSSGLGSSVVKSLTESGSEVIGIDWKGQPDIRADLSDKTEVLKAMGIALSMCPNPAGVVSNAGLSPIHDDLTEIIEVNWFAAKEVFELSLESLSKHKNSAAVAVCSIGSALGGDSTLESYLHEEDREGAFDYLDSIHKNDPNSAGIIAYSSCKAALARFVRRNAQRWGTKGVRFNAVAPGKMNTSMLDGLLNDPVLSPGIINLPSGVTETGQPEQVADVVEYLLSPKSSFIHGQVIYVDGGSEAIMRPDLV